MSQSKLIAVVTEKKNKNTSISLEVMEMKYRVDNNTLWITDHRGYIKDFDLDVFDVEIKSK